MIDIFLLENKIENKIDRKYIIRFMYKKWLLWNVSIAWENAMERLY